ncbi:NADP-dependent 3-hydroxy acid dehydrogenase YdfG [Actinopolyspora mzabensis]|uniref:NADP-dependent 3-hydroxy acid dehydrogenase YdfG n=1 Tax=Actinopolyspora mzabensis TaxID=995066 RepID=A0A1G8Y124_ACTMZ|nr:SDR family NAD(P)-dependent oxidoreductase [Actinopolyspora mzabensis]SDJ96549.1 NADP-dependent 3-hydroxy acid dehydrogenase YdfG [Actinopolyspora mzabensis]
MSTWLITGAGRGFGLQIARAAVAGGDAVVAASRRPEDLPDELTQSDRVLGVALDVTCGEDITRAVDTAVEHFGGIDVLVNNAGRGLLGALEEIGDAEARSLFDLNVFGLINMTRAVLPVMRAAGHGKIVNIGSRGGFEGEPGVSMYNASKFAVAGISEALAAEMAPFGIESMVVEPGVFRTDFLDASSLSMPAHRIPAYDGTPAHDTLDWSGEANHTQLGDPAKAAALIYEVTSQQDKLPGHLPLGRDAIERQQIKIQEIQDVLAAWQEKSIATACDDAS